MAADTPTDRLTPTIAALNGALAAQAAAVAARDRAIAEILSIVRDLRKTTSPKELPRFLAVVRHLYWQHQAIGSHDLTEAAGYRSPGEMTAALGPVPSGMHCVKCGAEFMKTSRSWKAPNDFLCGSCNADASEERRRRYRVARQREEYAAEAPVTAPIIEWEVAARLVLAYPPITTGWDDETARHNGMWRAYEQAQALANRIAEADGTHLTVPAESVERLIAVALEAVGFDLTRTWELVVPLTNEAPTAILTRLDRRTWEAIETRQAEAFERFPMPDSDPAR